jgi:uncharacterized protein
MPKIELLVVQPTPFCNINCSYCYLPDRGSKAVMADETLHNLFLQVFASGWACNELSIVWHAGEPMVLPIEFYRRAFRTIEGLKPRDVEVRHSFQTNGTLVTERWCEFFAEADVKVGVSIDGPERFHDRNRLTRSGRGTFDRTIAGVRLLRKHRLPFHVISVLTAESLAAPREMFDFYVAEGIDQVCFNVEETEGDHRSRSFAQAGIEDAYYRFLAEFWRLAAANPAKLSFIREIEDATLRVLRPKEATVANQLTTPFAMLNVDWTGNVATFSPELLGLKNANYDDFILGNVNRDKLTELAQRPTFLKLLADIDAGVALCRESCEYFSVCGGGEPINKLSENGSFISTETTYCRMTRMRTTDLVLDLLDRVEEGAGQGASGLGAPMLAAADTSQSVA